MTGRGPEGVVRAQQWQPVAVETCTDSATWLPSHSVEKVRAGSARGSVFAAPPGSWFPHQTCRPTHRDPIPL